VCAGVLSQKWIVAPFIANGGTGTVTWQYHGFVRQSKNLFVNAAHQQFVIASRQVSPAYASRKEDVSAEEELVIGRVETETPWTMAGDKENSKSDSAKFSFGCLLNQKIRLNRFRFQKKPELFEKIRICDERNSLSVKCNRTLEYSFYFRRVIDMIDVAVSDQQEIGSYREIVDPIRSTRRRIKENVSPRCLHKIGIGIENTPNKRLKVKHSE
jgi:hypothetical protein